MNPKERAIAALEGRVPHGLVPTFELEFQLTEEAFGRSVPQFQPLVGVERERAVAEYVDLHLQVAERYDWSIVRVYDEEVLRRLVAVGADQTYLLCAEADGTMAIPDGSNMEDLAVALAEEPERIHADLRREADRAIERGRRLIDAGAACLTMCADYCFNDGPFLSPRMFGEFVAPYLAEIVDAHRTHGAYVIKHTDGDILPIIDQIVAARPHALHSLDPQAGVDIADLKARFGSEICLCGNVNCALMQTGTDDEVVASAEYALRHGMPGGGYIFCTSNVAFKGMALERYELMLSVRERLGWYGDRPGASQSSA